MKASFSNTYLSVTDLTVEYDFHEMSDGSTTLNIETQDSLHMGDNALLAINKVSINMTSAQLRALSRAITQHLMTNDGPTINDIIKSIEESEANA